MSSTGPPLHNSPRDKTNGVNYLGRRVLFFGRKGCHASDSAIKFMTSLGFEVKTVFSKKMDEQLSEDNVCWEGDYIFCFRSYFILPPDLIKKAKLGAINFHPAPPEYPGSGCLNFALYENAKMYGVTAHLMNEKVDNGDIVRVIRFPVFDEDNVKSLLDRTHHYLLKLFHDVVNSIAIDEEFLAKSLAASQNEKWQGDARKMKELNEHQVIDLDVTHDELIRRVRAFHTDEYPLKIFLHGFEFNLVKR